MKTPLRNFWQWQSGEHCLNKRNELRCSIQEQATRWHRKNRIRQLKHTIAILTRKLRDTERCLAHTQLSPQKVLVIPDHWCERYTQIRKELNKP